MKRLFSLLIIFLLFISFFSNCYATDINSIDNNIDNKEESNVDVLDLYNVFYLIAFILVVIFLYIFICHILRVR